MRQRHILDELLSPTKAGGKPNRHVQPRDAESIIDKVEQLPRSGRPGHPGFDAIGIVVVELKNDGTPVKLVTEPPAPATGSTYHYAQMVSRLSHLYEQRAR